MITNKILIYNNVCTLIKKIGMFSFLLSKQYHYLAGHTSNLFLTPCCLAFRNLSSAASLPVLSTRSRRDRDWASDWNVPITKATT